MRKRDRSRGTTGPTASTGIIRDTSLSTEKSRRELRQAVVSIRLGTLEDAPNMRMKTLLAPVVPGRLFCAGGLPLTRCLQQRRRRRGVVAGVVAVWQGVPSLRPTGTGILVHESARHDTEYKLRQRTEYPVLS